MILRRGAPDFHSRDYCQHDDIPTISRALAPDLKDIPVVWPGDRFNVIFRFRRPDGNAPWSFDQVVPVMLQGDKPELI